MGVGSRRPSDLPSCRRDHVCPPRTLVGPWEDSVDKDETWPGDRSVGCLFGGPTGVRGPRRFPGQECE